MKYDLQKLKAFCAGIMQAAGLNDEDSEIFAESLVNADARGVGSHGVTRLTAYSRRVAEGLISADARPEIAEDGGSLLLVDANNGIGAVTAKKVMDLCMERAKETGCCFATVRAGNHFGYGAFFTEYAADKGMIGISLANAPCSMAPVGGRESMLGTNPLSVAIPAGEYRPLVLDMATSVVARGKITLAKKEGRTIPAGWGVDKNGVVTTDPGEVTAVLPFGGAKGYGIALIIEILSSCLSGARPGKELTSMYDYTQVQNSGFFLGAVNIEKIMPLDLFKASVDRLFASIKNSEKADGVKEIYLPGEIEFNKTVLSEREGVELSGAVAAELQALAERYHVPFNCAK